MKLEEIRQGKWFRWSLPGVEKARDLTPPEKIALERKNTLLTEKAQSRQTECWAYECNGSPSIWVREVCFDFKDETVHDEKHATISSADIEGPVPGFCWLHRDGDAPRQLVEAIYRGQPEIVWGAKPTRWWIIFTDGSKLGGPCVLIDPEQLQPDIVWT